MAESGNRAGDDEPRSPWLRGGFVLAVAFIGFVAVIGAVVLITSDSSGPGGREDGSTAASAARKATPPAGGGATESPPSAAGGAGASCPELADKRKELPAEMPGGVTWTLFQGVALPSSKAAGPAVTERDVARCYAHTPLGALLATSQISVRYLAADDWRQVTRTQTVGAGRQSYIAARAKAERTAGPETPGGEGQGEELNDGQAQGQIAGFKFVTYTSSTAVIQTVWRFPDGRMQAATTTVLWRDGDWRLEYPADPAAPTPVDSLAGYVKWGGV
ncbi:hypothetical protein ACQEU8_04050 [Streptomyces sp. CA-250714]|uniref:hypothetical protein n=1 Tax=Streptomyces sp. CA-250714 TaxID=3240060 RepID=UPI003D91C871